METASRPQATGGIETHGTRHGAQPKVTDLAKKPPSIQLLVTHLEDADRALLVATPGGRVAHSIFVDLMLEARRKRNGGRFTNSIRAIGLIIGASEQEITDAINVIARVCAENGTEPWLLLDDDGTLTIRSFTKYHDSRGGDRKSQESRSNGEEIKTGSKRIKRDQCETFDRVLIPKNGSSDSDSDSDSDSREIYTHTREGDQEQVAEIVRLWGTIRQIGDGRGITHTVRQAVNMIAGGRIDTIPPGAVEDAGGPAEYLLAKTRAFVESPQATKQGGKFCYTGKRFFGGYEPAFAMDPSDWMDGKQARAPDRDIVEQVRKHAARLEEPTV